MTASVDRLPTGVCSSQQKTGPSVPAPWPQINAFRSGLSVFVGDELMALLRDARVAGRLPPEPPFLGARPPLVLDAVEVVVLMLVDVDEEKLPEITKTSKEANDSYHG